MKMLTIKEKWEKDAEAYQRLYKKEAKKNSIQERRQKNGNSKKEGISSGRYTGQ